MIKDIGRSIVKPFIYAVYYLPLKGMINRSRDKKPLKKGITAVISMKNEEYTIGFCLESLVGVADQIVCIDNGSVDKSLEKANEFKKNFGDQVEMEIVSMPDALLGDCREEGLRRTRYQWHLRWDADMVASVSGENNMLNLREKVMKINKPCSFQLSRTNLFGDLRHTKGRVVDDGEPFLVWFNKDVFYKEYGRFDAIRIPFYYTRNKEPKSYIFHCAGLKSDLNLIHRFHYFKWRELTNKYGKENLPDFCEKLEDFKMKREKYLFDTEDPKSIKYRYQRQISGKYEMYDEDKYGKYPQVLLREMNSGNERFKITYKDDKPFLRIDNGDEMKDYQPTKEDQDWQPAEFFKKLKREDQDLLGLS